MVLPISFRERHFHGQAAGEVFLRNIVICEFSDLSSAINEFEVDENLVGIFQESGLEALISISQIHADVFVGHDSHDSTRHADEENYYREKGKYHK